MTAVHAECFVRLLDVEAHATRCPVCLAAYAVTSEETSRLRLQAPVELVASFGLVVACAGAVVWMFLAAHALTRTVVGILLFLLVLTECAVVRMAHAHVRAANQGPVSWCYFSRVDLARRRIVHLPPPLRA